MRNSVFEPGQRIANKNAVSLQFSEAAFLLAMCSGCSRPGYWGSIWVTTFWVRARIRGMASACFMFIWLAQVERRTPCGK